MSHLGLWLSAQVDGELDGVERDRVLNHLAGCDECRDEANALRALKRRMTALGESAGDAAIAGRLMELARPGSDVAAPAAIRTPWYGPSTAGLAARLPAFTWRVATGSAGTALLAIGLLAFVLGGGAQQDRSAPHVTPAVDSYWTQHSFDTGQTPASGFVPTGSIAPAGPVMIPVGSPGTHMPATTAPGTVRQRSANVQLRLSSP